MHVDAGSGVRIWSSAAWRERAVGWLDEQLIEAAIERTGPVSQPRVRPWATLLTAPTTARPVWLKAAAPRTAFEVGLYQLLHPITPDRVLAPLATDPARGWILLPDGGPALGERLDGAALVDAMVTVLPRYARMQRELAPHAEEMLGLGVDDMRPARMPERFEQALTAVDRYLTRHGTAADKDTMRQLVARRATVAEYCTRQAGSPGASSIDHNDLHPRNILFDEAGGLAATRFYDWGDAVLAHPFASMLVGLGVMRGAVLGVDVDDLRVRRMRDAYLAEFADLAGHAELVETLQLACRVGRIAAALTWDRAVRTGEDDDAVEVDDDWRRAPFESLAGLLDEAYL